MSDSLFRVLREGPVNILELRLPSHLDNVEFDRLNDAVLAALAVEPDGRWVLDLSSLSYAGSSLLGLMVNARQRVLEAGGTDRPVRAFVPADAGFCDLLPGTIVRYLQ